MKRFFLTFIVIFTVTAAMASNDTIRPPRPKVGVALGGGGAKGAAHIGVLKYIEEMGIPIDYVAGTSMGAIIGGLYAMGYTPDELAELIANINWSEYVGNSIDRTVMSPEMRQRRSTLALNIPFSLEGLTKVDKKKSLTDGLPSAFVNNTALINLFNDLCVGYQDETDFNDLPIPFACVATNIATGKEVDIRQGSVPNAMRASMAIPGVFSPVLMDNQVLVDGGLVNNFPADVLRDMGADIIIGVEVSDKLEIDTDETPSLISLFNCLITNAVNSKRNENQELCSIYLAPDITGYGTMSFNPEAIDTLVNRGYKKAKEYHEQMANLKQYVDATAGYPVSKQLHAPRARNLKAEPVFIQAITMNRSNMAQSKWLTRKGQLTPGRYMSSEDIDKAVNIFRGTGAFNDITYNITECDTGDQPNDSVKAYNLIFDFKPTPPHIISVGSRYDTEEGAAMLISLGINEKRLSGFKFNLSTRLSYNPRINVTATYPLMPVANLNAAYDFRSQHFKMMVNDNKKYTNLHIQQNQFSVYLSQFQLYNFSVATGITFTSTNFDQAFLGESANDTLDLSISRNPALDDNRIYSPYVHFNFDNMDDDYFARHGINTTLDARLHLDAANKQDMVHDASLSFIGNITPNDGKFTIIPQLYSRVVFGDALYANLWNTIGGEVAGRHFIQQMPFIGVSHVNQTGDLTSILRCDLRYNFYGKHYLTATYNFLYNYNFATTTKPASDTYYSGAGLRYAYGSPIGPISLTAQWSDCTRQFSMYFSIGYTF